MAEQRCDGGQCAYWQSVRTEFDNGQIGTGEQHMIMGIRWIACVGCNGMELGPDGQLHCPREETIQNAREAAMAALRQAAPTPDNQNN